jgi:nicotinate-nucleotide adenylyltransferase
MRSAATSGFVRLPPYGAGQAIGLLGGSFNPPHVGHLLASRLALSRAGLDRVWWLATPGNPLKSDADLAALHARLAAARALLHDPRIAVTGFESEIGARYTADTLAYLSARAPGARFVWIMGADNLAQFHRWRHWREIAALAPMLVIDRPGSSFAALSSRAAQALARWRVPEREAGRLAWLAPPAWVFLHGPRSGASSTALRARGRSG